MQQVHCWNHPRTEPQAAELYKVGYGFLRAHRVLTRLSLRTGVGKWEFQMDSGMVLPYTRVSHALQEQETKVAIETQVSRSLSDKLGANRFIFVGVQPHRLSFCDSQKGTQICAQLLQVGHESGKNIHGYAMKAEAWHEQLLRVKRWRILAPIFRWQST